MKKSSSFGSRQPPKEKLSVKQADTKSQRKVIKPPWNSEVVDQSSFKLTREETYKRHIMHQSKNIEAAKLTLLKKNLDLSLKDSQNYGMEKSWMESPIKIEESQNARVTISPLLLNEVSQGIVVDLRTSGSKIQELQPTKAPSPPLENTHNCNVSPLNSEFDSKTLSSQVFILKANLENEIRNRQHLEKEVAELKILVSQLIKEVLHVKCSVDKDFFQNL